MYTDELNSFCKSSIISGETIKLHRYVPQYLMPEASGKSIKEKHKEQSIMNKA